MVSCGRDTQVMFSRRQLDDSRAWAFHEGVLLTNGEIFCFEGDKDVQVNDELLKIRFYYFVLICVVDLCDN